jgi:hypothetical protein
MVKFLTRQARREIPFAFVRPNHTSDSLQRVQDLLAVTQEHFPRQFFNREESCFQHLLRLNGKLAPDYFRREDRYMAATG